MARTKTSTSWMRAHVNDPYVRRAQTEGYRSRAAYKLREIALRDALFKPRMIVVDLGAAPGGWSQVAAQLTAPGGMVIAVDVLDMPPLPDVLTVKGALSDDATLAVVERSLAGRAVDLVLSDMAPNITGI